MEPLQPNTLHQHKFIKFESKYDCLELMVPEGWRFSYEFKPFYSQYRFVHFSNPTLKEEEHKSDDIVNLMVVKTKVQSNFTTEKYIEEYEGFIKKSPIETKFDSYHQLRTKEEENDGQVSCGYWKINFKEDGLEMYQEICAFVKDSYRYQTSMTCSSKLKEGYLNISKFVFDSLKENQQQEGIIFTGFTNRYYLMNLKDIDESKPSYNTMLTYYTPGDVHWKSTSSEYEFRAIHNTIPGFGMQIKLLQYNRMTIEQIIGTYNERTLPNSRILRCSDPGSLAYETYPFNYNLQSWKERYNNSVDTVEIHQTLQDIGDVIEMFLTIQQRTIYFSFFTGHGKFHLYKHLFQIFLNYLKFTDMDPNIQRIPLYIENFKVYNDMLNQISIMGVKDMNYLIKDTGTFSIVTKTVRITVICLPIRQDKLPLKETRFSDGVLKDVQSLAKDSSVSNFLLVQKSASRMLNYKATLIAAEFEDGNNTKFIHTTKSAVIAQKYMVKISITTSDPFTIQNTDIIFDSLRLGYINE